MKNIVSKLIDKINQKMDKKKEKVQKENLELPGIYVQYTVILTGNYNRIPIMRYTPLFQKIFLINVKTMTRHIMK